MGVCETHCSPGLEGAENGVLRGWGGGGPTPHEGRGDGEGGEPWVSKNGAAPPALILADLEAGPSGHLKYLPHPVLGLG